MVCGAQTEKVTYKLPSSCRHCEKAFSANSLPRFRGNNLITIATSIRFKIASYLAMTSFLLKIVYGHLLFFEIYLEIDLSVPLHSSRDDGHFVII